MVNYNGNRAKLRSRAMKTLQPHIDRHTVTQLFATPTVMSEKERKKVHDAIWVALNLECELPKGLLHEFGIYNLQDGVNPPSPPDDNEGPPF